MYAGLWGTQDTGVVGHFEPTTERQQPAHSEVGSSRPSAVCFLQPSVSVPDILDSPGFGMFLTFSQKSYPTHINPDSNILIITTYCSREICLFYITTHHYFVPRNYREDVRLTGEGGGVKQMRTNVLIFACKGQLLWMQGCGVGKWSNFQTSLTRRIRQ